MFASICTVANGAFSQAITPQTPTPKTIPGVAQPQISTSQIKQEIDTQVTQGLSNLSDKPTKEDVAAARKNFTNIGEDARALTTTTKSPLLVRGGAMTARVKKDNPWQAHTGGTWCSDGADPSYIELFDVTATSAGATPLAIDNITTDWKISMTGHKPKGADSGIGITLLMRLNKQCDDTTVTGKHSVILSVYDPQSSGKPSFYPDNDAVNEGGGGMIVAKRYFDTTDHCGKPDANGDEDACERMSQITLAIPSTSMTPYTYKCDNGECALAFGKQ